MIICAAQTRPIKGKIRDNVNDHKRHINLAVADKTDLIIFPELSLTGYEPALADSLAIHINDTRLDDFQRISDKHGIIIGAGAPIRQNEGVCIGMIVFQPGQKRELYSKKYLHTDEEPYFTRGESQAVLKGGSSGISFCICYELSIPEHAEEAFRKGSEIYAASVAKTAGDLHQAGKRLSEIAAGFSMSVIMSNCVGESGGMICGGGTSAWNRRGERIASLGRDETGVLILDTETEKSIKRLM